MKIKKCRICNSVNFYELFSLGNLSFTGKFTKSKINNIPRDYLNLVMCKKCKLVQLDRSFNPKFLYSKDYGYRTGINKTMTEHVKNVVKEAIKISKVKKDDYVLDIASNDATLLNFYPKYIITFGVDPLVKKYINFYKNIDYKVSNFFNIKDIKKKRIRKKFKIITALSVFYDLRDPNRFIREVSEILDEEGIFVLEHADLYSIIKNNIFDTICHEHLVFYSSKIIIEMMKNNGLKVFNHEYNEINGGSSRYYICHSKTNFKVSKNIKKVLLRENLQGIELKKTYKLFFTKILNEKIKLIKLIKKIKNEEQDIHGYGASTKGNVLLQFYNINNKVVNYIADRNPLKWNSFTPGTKIKIISESQSRKIKPHFYLVLPWHFKNEILIREKNIRKKGTKFIFPLPKVRVV